MITFCYFGWQINKIRGRSWGKSHLGRGNLHAQSYFSDFPELMLITHAVDKKRRVFK